MEEINIIVPKDVRYISDLKNNDGTPFELPNGILHKGLTGAGGTHLALTDSHSTLICSPRIKLMECKKQQMGDKLLLVMQGVTNNDIEQYLDTYKDNPKIMTTYDSCARVLKCIGDMSQWRVVVDEFQCFLTDSSFKSETEITFLRELQHLPYVTYLSATPIPTEYLQQIPEFSNIAYHSLIWEKTPVIYVNRRQAQYPANIVKNVIDCYKNNKYPVCLDEDGKEVESKEAVFYINSVNMITNIIHDQQLSADEVNIIVANTEENVKVVEKLGKDYSVGRIPGMDEERKPFTFCTSTAYFGIDMYSDNASTFVVSDTTRGYTSVDIRTELLQIAGRQRNEANPFKNIIHLYFNSTASEETEQEYRERMNEKMEFSKMQLEFYKHQPQEKREICARKVMEMQMIENYEVSYIMYDKDIQDFAINRMKYLSDMMRYHVQYVEYQNSTFLDAQLKGCGFSLNGDSKAMYYYGKLGNAIVNTNFEEKMIEYCRLKDLNTLGAKAVAANMARDMPELKLYYNVLGKEKIMELNCNLYKLKDEYQIVMHHDEIENALREHFHSGDIMTADRIKIELRLLLTQLAIEPRSGITAQMLERFGFKLQEKKVREGGKRMSRILINR